jgi:CheY-like chemotaxis protein
MALLAPPLPAGPKVLVADDDFLVQRCAIALLRQLGCRGVVVENGQQALACLHAQDFDLVLLDVSMPVLDGLAALAQLRAREAGTRVHQRVAMLSAHVDADSAVRLHAAGADGTIPKPIDPDRFCGEVRRLLDL